MPRSSPDLELIGKILHELLDDAIDCPTPLVLRIFTRSLDRLIANASYIRRGVLNVRDKDEKLLIDKLRRCQIPEVRYRFWQVLERSPQEDSLSAKQIGRIVHEALDAYIALPTYSRNIAATDCFSGMGIVADRDRREEILEVKDGDSQTLSAKIKLFKNLFRHINAAARRQMHAAVSALDGRRHDTIYDMKYPEIFTIPTDSKRHHIHRIIDRAISPIPHEIKRFLNIPSSLDELKYFIDELRMGNDILAINAQDEYGKTPLERLTAKLQDKDKLLHFGRYRSLVLELVQSGATMDLPDIQLPKPPLRIFLSAVIYHFHYFAQTANRALTSVAHCAINTYRDLHHNILSFSTSILERISKLFNRTFYQDQLEVEPVAQRQ